MAEGVFATAPDGAVRFVPSPRPPTDVEVGRLLATVRRRIVRLVRRHGLALDVGAADGGIADGLALAAELKKAPLSRRPLEGPRGAVVSDRAFTSTDSYDGASYFDLEAGKYIVSIDGVADTTAAYSFRLLDLAKASEF